MKLDTDEVEKLADALAEVLDDHGYDVNTTISALLICVTVGAAANTNSREEFAGVLGAIAEKLTDPTATARSWADTSRAIKYVSH